MKSYGFDNIKTFNSPDDALGEIGSTLFPTLVITDFMMPLINGLDLALSIKTKNPKTKVIIYTGIPDFVREINDKYLVVEKANFVEIIEVVRKLLGTCYKKTAQMS